MAINLTTTPKLLAAGYNPIVYTFSGSNNTLTGYRYLVDVYSGDTTASLIARFKVVPTQFGDGYIDISKILQSYLSVSFDPLVVSTDGDAFESYLSYSTRIGEEYRAEWPYNRAFSASTGVHRTYTILSGDTAHPYIAGDQINAITTSTSVAGLHTVLSAGTGPTANQIIVDHIAVTSPILISGLTIFADSRKVATTGVTSSTGTTVFNGALDWPTWKTWLGTDHILNIATSSTTKFLLTSLEPQTSVTDITRRFYMTPTQALWINFFVDAPTSGFSAHAEHYNRNGQLLEATIVGIENVTQGRIKQIKVDVNNFLFTNIQEGDYMRFRILRTSDDGIRSRWYVVYFDTRCQRETLEVYFMDRKGSILSQAFMLNSSETIQVERETIKKAIQYGNNSSLDLTKGGSTNININYDRSFQLETNWLTDANIELIEELITSRYTWLKIDGQYLPVIVQDKGYEITKQRNKRLLRKTISVTFANQNPIN